MFSGENLAYVRSGRIIFKGLSFDLKPSEHILLQGPNGSGKSTLLQVLMGVLAPRAGTVRWQDQNVEEDIKAYHRHIQYLGHRNGLQPSLDLVQNASFWMGLAGIKPDEKIIESALKAVGLFDFADFPSHVLSAGQQRRLAIARLIVTKPKLWLLDEPTVSLDEASKAKFFEILQQHLHQGGMAIIATHDIQSSGGKKINMVDYHA